MGGHDHLHRSIEERARANAASIGQPNCFDACKGPYNRTSDCYIECLVTTVVGRHALAMNVSTEVKPMSRGELAAPLKLALSRDDYASGGCPGLPPYVPPSPSVS